LRPIVRDEIYKIAAEALRNCFEHAQAGQVEVEIRYDSDEFRLRVRDDGKGIDQAKASIKRFSRPKASRDTTDCAACQNVRH
jgi:signal transduction histidine kinase